MDILIVTQDFPPERGGIQTYMVELAREFLRRGHRVRVICPGGSGTPNPEGVSEVTRLPVPSSWLFLALRFYLPGYLRRNPSVTRVLYAQWQAALADPLPGRRRHRSYCLVHGRELLTSVLGPLAPALMRRVFRRLDAALPNSDAVRRLLMERVRPACAVYLTHPGVDADRFRPLDAGFLRERYGVGDAPVVVSITRMVARKRLRLLVEAWPAVAAGAPGAALILCGEGPEREALMRRAGELGVEGSVRFPGRVAEAELAAHFNLGDVFALPSVSSGRDIEGFGIVFLEAGACGTAVVGARSGGIPDAVADGETGLLVPPEDAEKLAGALLALLRDREKAREMGRRARARVLERFTWAHAAGRILDMLD